ncbi:hypothetical protein KDX27_40835 [Burkholderia cenocepacia]|uniref:sodium:solute symporter family transporter n=1 Tax=Burkholderia cenocepacia TaxID=95486 RepID=UPI001B9EF3DB|nr:hypothetical protein [Burkholderia cenocepacia]MBR8030152.1 hypothetical protein [Burkholderia cenocepacia]MBR8174030.1 hypothetical protein [Burkholderia cenocepacia]
MDAISWLTIGLYLFVVCLIGWWAQARVSNVSDYFTGGSRIPWWLAGISHHMSGYSAVVFVAYAGVAYQFGVTVYFWWALSVAFGTAVGAYLFAPKWANLVLRRRYMSPLEFVCVRYNRPTQQLFGWIGAGLKVFGTGAKWAAIGSLVHFYTNVPEVYVILLVGCVTLLYCTIGGLWADSLTGLWQFIVQLLAGVAVAVFTFMALTRHGPVLEVIHRLPPSHFDLLAGPYNGLFLAAYLLINSLNYSGGGNWDLAQRFMSTPSVTASRKAGLLSSALYAFWPIVLFFPMVVAPILLPPLHNPQTAYAELSRIVLPSGMLGIVIASFLAHTMSFTASDANAISAVVTRDILPPLLPESKRHLADHVRTARTVTFVYAALSILIAVESDRFGGVLALIVVWFEALIGTIAVPLLFGLLPSFRRSGSAAAIASCIAGIISFVVVKYAIPQALAWVVATPVSTTVVTYIVWGIVFPSRSAKAEGFFRDLLAGSEREVFDHHKIGTTSTS